METGIKNVTVKKIGKSKSQWQNWPDLKVFLVSCLGFLKKFSSAVSPVPGELHHITGHLYPTFLTL